MEFDENNLGHGAKDRPKDYGKDGAPLHSEIAGALAPAIWTEKDPIIGFQTYPKRNQGQASDCVDYAYAKAVAVDYENITGVYRELSPHSLYCLSFEQGGGSDSQKVGSMILPKYGITLEALFPSDGLTESQAESQAGYVADAKMIATLYTVPGIIEANSDFETIASILQGYQQQGKKKVVMVTIIGQNNGTWLSTTPTPPNLPPTSDDPSFWYHKVPVCDFGLINGEKVLAIDQSWGATVTIGGQTYPVGNNGQQFLTEAYAPYMYGALYTMDPVDSTAISVQPPKPPKHTFTVQLQIGSNGQEVTILQQALQSLGMFPISSIIAPTGVYGGITANAVKTFQATFGIAISGIVDGPTIAKLNTIFGQ